MEDSEPSEDDLEEKVQDLVIGLTGEERLDTLAFASTPTTARLIIGELPEMGELLLYGARAGRAIGERLPDAAGRELAVLAYAIEMLGYGDALVAIATKVAELPEDGTESMLDNFLLSAFETLNTQRATGRRAALIEEAKALREPR